MKLNQREKILLGILAFMVLGWLYYNFALTPQLAAIEEAKTKLAALENTREEILRYTDPQGAVLKQAKELDDKIAAATDKYFPEIIQERIIRILDQMLAASLLEGRVLSFSPITVGTILEKDSAKKATADPSKQQPFLLQDLTVQLDKDNKKLPVPPPLPGDGSVYKMETTVEFQGQYNQVMAFMDQLEKYKRKIIVSNITMDENQGQLKGSMVLHFYGIPKMHQQDNDYVTWDIFDVYGRGNPFKP